ncbi:MAG: hypothetical protein MZV70_63180 [Desulfobacterales bacterium]|nr:hypothetical protein [Desulfobacterales bacterium]
MKIRKHGDKTQGKDGQATKPAESPSAPEPTTTPWPQHPKFRLGSRTACTRVHPRRLSCSCPKPRSMRVSEKLLFTSTWRPMVGSIAHRAGLGLDGEPPRPHKAQP